MNVEDWGRVTGYWVEGIATGLVVAIIPLFVMGLAVGVGVKVFTLPVRRFE